MSASVIAVGVDGSAASDLALQVAVDDARQSGSTVRAITAWVGVGPYSPEMIMVEPDLSAAQAALIQKRAIERVLGGVDDPPEVEERIVEGGPGPALVKAAAGASRLVVGSVHKGVLKRVTEGSTSAYCARHSQIPVLVVPFVQAAYTEASAVAEPAPAD